ncbi:hypothetical protein ACIQGW_16030 [Lysinibacillus xylanilyticus]
MGKIKNTVTLHSFEVESGLTKEEQEQNRKNLKNAISNMLVEYMKKNNLI